MKNMRLYWITLSFVAAVLSFVTLYQGGMILLPKSATIRQIRPNLQKEKVVIPDSVWVDSVFNQLTIDERIGQLFMIRAHSNKDTAYYAEIEKQILQYKVGGICFFQGGPVQQAQLTNRWQKISKVPMLIAIDGEWGLGMRLDSTISFPRQMMLGAIQDNTLIEEMGEEIGRHCRRIGINMNFAPVADINSNPKNPVINSRSFGEDKKNVADKAFHYARGMQKHKVLACAKHFPGHGDTDSDSHFTLPVILHSLSTIDTIDLYPFRKLIEEGVASVMVAHLQIPVFDTSRNTASSLSRNIVTSLLRHDLMFNGLIITDALEMQGVSSYHKPGNIELMALRAGNDILLLPPDIDKAVNTIKNAIQQKKIAQQLIDKACKRILLYKYKAGLHNYLPCKINNIHGDLNSNYTLGLRQKLIEKSITLLINKNSSFPIGNLSDTKIASLSIGAAKITCFQKTMNLYAPVTHFQIEKNPTAKQINAILDSLKSFDKIIVGMHSYTNSPAQHYGITQGIINLIDTLKQQHPIILDIFTNPYCLKYFSDTTNIKALIMSYQDDSLIEAVSAQAIFGGIPVSGKLPVHVNKIFSLHCGITISDAVRLKYGYPELLNIKSDDLYAIDTMALNCIEQGIFPGCQILAAKNGCVFYHKSFGYHTYKKDDTVQLTDLYDLASLTKIYATVPVIMKWVDEKKFDVDKPFGYYLPALRGSNKYDIIIRNMLAHQGRFKSWIPFFEETIKNSKPDSKIYQTKYSSAYPVQVAENLYIRKDYKDTIFKRILDSPLNSTKYVYSDLGYYYLKEIIEKISKTTFPDYVKKNFITPLGLQTLCFLPRERFKQNKIIPTENDTIFRKQLLHGHVNDPGAAMLGGYSGHAGLFGNANDLAIFSQMYLNRGIYGNKRFISESTIKEFTRYQFPENKNRRGLGFDKPIALIKERNGQTADSASWNSFGHSGYTGTFVWIDPDYQMIYILLTNRVHPDAKNNKLVKLDIRSKMQQIFYDAIIKSKQH